MAFDGFLSFHNGLPDRFRLLAQPPPLFQPRLRAGVHHPDVGALEDASQFAVEKASELYMEDVPPCIAADAEWNLTTEPRRVPYRDVLHGRLD